MNILLLLFLSFANAPSPTTPNTANITVYICNSPTAKKYHLNQHCKGLSSCQYKIIKLTLAQAQQKGRTLCGWEKGKH